MIKPASYADGWFMFDSMRGITNGGADARLYANDAGGENAGNSYLDLTATGFKPIGGTMNSNGEEYIFMAVRRNNKPAEEFEPEELFNTVSVTQDGKPSAVTNFPVDMGILRNYGADEVVYLTDRLRNGKRLNTASSDAEVAGSDSFEAWDYNNGYLEVTWDTSTYLSWSWRRTPHFFDVVCYEGNGVTGRDITHSLGVKPEMIWTKGRSLETYWCVWHESYGTTNNQLRLESDGPLSSGYFAENPSTPPVITDETFSVNANGYINGVAQDYIAYLWASVPGLCDIGVYEGTGGDLFVDCGFAGPSRFVLIKNADGSGDWFVWDTERGFEYGPDPYLTLNNTTAQVTGTSYVTNVSGGFNVRAAAPASINESGKKYIYMAIA